MLSNLPASSLLLTHKHKVTKLAQRLPDWLLTLTICARTKGIARLYHGAHPGNPPTCSLLFVYTPRAPRSRHSTLNRQYIHVFILIAALNRVGSQVTFTSSYILSTIPIPKRCRGILCSVTIACCCIIARKFSAGCIVAMLSSSTPIVFIYRP
jgi:hypothetical protein